MRAELGDEPEHPLEVVISNPPGQDATRTPQLSGNVGQRSLHSARISEETRTADTATLCQTQKVSLGFNSFFLRRIWGFLTLS